MAEASISKQNLDRFVSQVRPELEELGFVYEEEASAFSSGGEFANGFFICDKFKVGIIFRKTRLGAIIYETNYSNISHDMLFEGLNLYDKNILRYNENILAMYSYTTDGSELYEAFLDDFKKVVYPYFISTPLPDINMLIKKLSGFT